MQMYADALGGDSNLPFDGDSLRNGGLDANASIASNEGVPTVSS